MGLLRNIIKPNGAVGDLRVIDGEDLDNKAKTQGHNRQIVAAYAKHRECEADRQESGA